MDKDMYREEMLDNYYMVKEAATGIVTSGYGAYRGSKGKSEGERAARKKYRNLTEEDIDDIRRESSGVGRGALRGLGWGALGALGGAAVTGAKGLAGPAIGGLALGTYKAHGTKSKYKKEFLRRARKKSEAKELARLRRR